MCANEWDTQDADVACKMMDFDGFLLAEFEYKERRPEELRVWLNNMRCIGNETNLLLCPHDDSVGSNGCKGKRKAGVVCRPKGKNSNNVT